jgi:hypothetical protein
MIARAESGEVATAWPSSTSLMSPATSAIYEPLAEDKG